MRQIAIAPRSWFETRGLAALLTMREDLIPRRRSCAVSKDGATALGGAKTLARLVMRGSGLVSRLLERMRRREFRHFEATVGEAGHPRKAT
jgi:hypothetical protein